MIVGLHGGSYKGEYFDGDARHTASLPSHSFGVPFVAVDRPCYGQTTSILPLPPNTSYTTRSAAIFHTQILPLLWKKIGVAESCTCMVLLCHSMGVMTGIATAAKHAQDAEPGYPLGGIIASGLGHQRHPEAMRNSTDFRDHPTAMNLPPIEMKDKVMYRPGTVDLAILEQSERLNQPMPVTEAAALYLEFVPRWRELWAPHIKAPVLFAMAEGDLYFSATSEHIQECLQALSQSKRVEGGLVPGAPHCMELSHWASGWYARCFGFAMECAASFAVATVV